MIIDEEIMDELDIEDYNTSSTESMSEDNDSVIENNHIDDESIEYDDDDIMADILETIHERNIQYLDIPKKTGQYCIGMSAPYGRQFLLATSLSTHLFLQIPYDYTFRYLCDYSGIYIHPPSVDIIKIKVLYDGRYIGVKKTFWLRIVQRTWKRIMKQRSEIMQKRRTIAAQVTFSLTGKYPSGLNVLPRLSGSIIRKPMVSL